MGRQRMAGTELATAPGLRFGDSLQALRERGAEEYPNLADSLYDLMWRRIVNLEFAPGTRLSDEALARDLGVSRTPMREALHRLSQIGLVRVNARRGFFVTTLERRDVNDLYDLRTALEVFAARLAAPLLTAEDLAPHIARQQAVLARATADAPADMEEFVQSDLLLHDLIVRRSGNGRMQEVLADIKGQLSLAHLRLAQISAHNRRAVEEHSLILEALAAGDTAAAADAVEGHLQAVKERVLAEFFPLRGVEADFGGAGATP